MEREREGHKEFHASFVKMRTTKLTNFIVDLLSILNTVIYNFQRIYTNNVISKPLFFFSSEAQIIWLWGFVSI